MIQPSNANQPSVAAIFASQPNATTDRENDVGFEQVT